MSTVHVSDRCRAKDRAACPVHGSGAKKQQAEALQTKINSLFVTIPVAKKPLPTSTNPSINRALSSSLSWDGEKPEWWNEYEQELANDEFAPTRAELIDVIDSPAGPLAVVWQDDNPEDKSLTLGSGYGERVTYFKSVETGEVLGYLKSTYMDENTVERSFGDDELAPFRWRSRYGSARYPFDDENYVYDGRNLEGEELLQKRRDVWVQAHKDLEIMPKDENGNRIGYWNITKEHVPSDVQVLKDLKKLGKKVQPEINESYENFATPYIDYSRVNGSLAGKGYGTAMYVYTARMLAKEGKALRGSGVQSDDAQGIWKRFKEKFPNNVSTMESTWRGQKHVRPVLDFRE